MAGIFDRYQVIDTDTHVSEPPDVWTARVSSKWGDLVPHVVRDPKGGPKDYWAIGDELFMPTGVSAMAEFEGMLPDHPDTLADAVPASYDAPERLAYMDREGIYAQILYPNVGGFGSATFLRLKEPELMLECVRAYNDFLVDWSSADPKRLIPVMATPFWDVDATLKEIERCAANGHKGVIFGGQPADFGEPPLTDPHWDPVWAAAQDAELPINFHIGAGAVGDLLGGGAGLGIRTGLARICTQLFMDNANCIADIIFAGVCHRFPKLNFVSVESGVSWLMFALEGFDWQWQNNGVTSEHPEYDLLPSEYFRRQIYGCFWFETDGLRGALEKYPDNILWETDFPHPTAMAPGPQSIAQHPRDYAERALAGVPEDTIRKVMRDNAARVYHLD
ncbi:MAG: amidohydrolase [Deltaproteobacteria bacterium]|nr:amidohydrolase [Deltaproteobacteria bacterium]